MQRNKPLMPRKLSRRQWRRSLILRKFHVLVLLRQRKLARRPKATMKRKLEKQEQCLAVALTASSLRLTAVKSLKIATFVREVRILIQMNAPHGAMVIVVNAVSAPLPSVRPLSCIRTWINTLSHCWDKRAKQVANIAVLRIGLTKLVSAWLTGNDMQPGLAVKDSIHTLTVLT